MKILGIMFLVLFVAVAAVLTYAASRPDDFRVERSASINATPEKIFPLINDLQAWRGWSPYERLDPAMKRTHSGAASGKGAVYAWDGNQNAGAGRMEIVESSPPSKLVIKLDFSRPFEGHNTSEFTLEPRGNATGITWAMYGRKPFAAKLMGIFVNTDNMIGRDFETGLANLKALAER
ncbi:MAG TPA: SRPBCC family protein [Xanthobacteraceae bacterium]|jgi:uncharacterized protein YndB with AHSA1/START domain